MHQATLRFYEELNDFLPEPYRKRSFPYSFSGKPTVKHAIEAVGVPHTEVDLILVNGKSVGFDHHLKEGDFVSVYPMFESIDIGPVNHLRPEPLRTPRFILDVHLGQLAKYMRMAGLDTLYETNYEDEEIIMMAEAEKRTVLTRDQGILKAKDLHRGYFVRNTDPKAQIREIIHRFDLYGQIKKAYRCITCNGLLHRVAKEKIIDQLPERTQLYYNEFYQCDTCGKVYWKGSHFQRIIRFLEELKNDQQE